MPVEKRFKSKLIRLATDVNKHELAVPDRAAAPITPRLDFAEQTVDRDRCEFRREPWRSDEIANCFRWSTDVTRMSRHKAERRVEREFNDAPKSGGHRVAVGFVQRLQRREVDRC